MGVVGGASHPKCAVSKAAAKELTRKQTKSASVSVQIDTADPSLSPVRPLADSNPSIEPGTSELRRLPGHPESFVREQPNSGASR
jgi:hypothetical protein